MFTETGMNKNDEITSLGSVYKKVIRNDTKS